MRINWQGGPKLELSRKRKIRKSFKIRSTRGNHVLIGSENQVSSLKSSGDVEESRQGGVDREVVGQGRQEESRGSVYQVESALGTVRIDTIGIKVVVQCVVGVGLEAMRANWGSRSEGHENGQSQENSSHYCWQSPKSKRKSLKKQVRVEEV
jgi:hypothetical protein